MRYATLLVVALLAVACSSGQPVGPLEGTYEVVFDSSFATPVNPPPADVETANNACAPVDSFKNTVANKSRDLLRYEHLASANAQHLVWVVWGGESVHIPEMVQAVTRYLAQRLIEKHAAALGVPNVTTKWVTFSGGGAT